MPTDGGRGDAGSGGGVLFGWQRGAVIILPRHLCTAAHNVHDVHGPDFQQQDVNDAPSQQGRDEALLTKAWMAVRGLAPLEEDGVPVLPLLPLAPPHSAATWVASPHPRSSSGPPTHALTFSASQIPAGEARHGSDHYWETHPAAPAMVNEVVQSNFFEGPQGSRNPNGENGRVNKTGGWRLMLLWLKEIVFEAGQTQYEWELFENIMRYILCRRVFLLCMWREGNRKIEDCQQNKWVSGLESAFAVGYLLAWRLWPIFGKGW